MDYKPTLNLPKTSFPMKGNLPQAESLRLTRWEEEKLYERILAARKGSPPFILHDGPPYANGDIHIGHALNKILKDFIVRHRTMRGHRSPYVPGWDCHGLPIEYALMKELKITKHQVDIVKFRKEARKYARKYVDIQRDQFKRLGVMGDWEHPYLTLEPEFIAAELRVLKTLVEKNFIYQARKPVNWCWNCETALAEAEVEYEDHTSPSVFVKFELSPESRKRLTPLGFDGLKKVYWVIWTTTPWTLMGNVAVSVHPIFKYAVHRRRDLDEFWVTSAQIPETVRKNLGLSSDPREVINTIQGRQLEGLSYRRPFDPPDLWKGKVVLADYVTLEEGTGLVHTAPGFGAEDFVTGKKHGLEVVAPVDSRGRFAGLPQQVKQFEGQHVTKEANQGIIDLLKEKGALVGDKQPLQHQYPHCWRCREPIIFRTTDQWFLNIEHDGLREKLLGVVENQIRWIPPVSRERMAGMIKTRPDWCLSRQRLWGVPVPAVICKACGKADLVPAVIENFAKVVESDPEGTDRWFSEPVTTWLPEGLTCLLCKKGKEFERGTDILDVWFDSSVSHQGVLAQRKELAPPPADLYLEGSDQHRGWFQVSLITGMALSGQAPYRGVLTHGFVVDGQGRKMSKSLGNVIAPQKVIDSMGADVLRLWVASSDHSEDVRISQEILNQTAETYRKIRNTIRFCLANANRSDLIVGKEGRFPSDNFQVWNRWVLVELGDLVRDVTQAYEQYAYHRVIKAVHEFCTLKLSNFYLDVMKDLLYTGYPKDPLHQEARTTLAIIVKCLIRLLAPILPITMEEAWTAFGKSENSIHLEDWPQAPEIKVSDSERADWQRLLQLRDEAMKALEKSRESGLIGDALEAELDVEVRDPKFLEFLKSRQDQFEAACIVSKLSLHSGDGEGPPLSMTVRKSPGEKCQRCWMRLTSVGESADHPTLCRRCVAVVRKLLVDGIIGTPKND